MVRGISLALDSRGYVLQARLARVSPFYLARWLYLPSLLPLLIVVRTGVFARPILGISSLGFLGFDAKLW